ncbi:hypothetical protein [uncultured Methylobacterium sp.]|uniref:hypothetical protein n=1 Tax=uncultured Methylobacterium sp. TaxID=157278 RepID=UPI0035CBFB43
MRSQPTPGPLRRAALALGLILPLADAAAQSGPGWVDPPAKVAPTTPAPAAASPQAPAVPPAPVPTQAAVAKPSVPEAQADGGAMSGPSRRAERPRMRRRAARRLADAPPAGSTPFAPPIVPRAAREGAADPRFPGWAGRAQALASDYLAVFSAPNGAMVADAPRFYGARLRFHGRMMTLPALIAEKRRFAQRWPERRYAPRASRTACNAAIETCVVRTIVDFRAGNPARGALSRGVAELVLEVNFSGGRPVIVSESSRVLRRGATVGALAGPRVSG